MKKEWKSELPNKLYENVFMQFNCLLLSSSFLWLQHGFDGWVCIFGGTWTQIPLSRLKKLKRQIQSVEKVHKPKQCVEVHRGIICTFLLAICIDKVNTPTAAATRTEPLTLCTHKSRTHYKHTLNIAGVKWI